MVRRYWGQRAGTRCLTADELVAVFGGTSRRRVQMVESIRRVCRAAIQFDKGAAVLVGGSFADSSLPKPNSCMVAVILEPDSEYWRLAYDGGFIRRVTRRMRTGQYCLRFLDEREAACATLLAIRMDPTSSRISLEVLDSFNELDLFELSSNPDNPLAQVQVLSIRGE